MHYGLKFIKRAVGSVHFVGPDFNPIDKEIPQYKRAVGSAPIEREYESSLWDF